MATNKKKSAKPKATKKSSAKKKAATKKKKVVKSKPVVSTRKGKRKAKRISQSNRTKSQYNIIRSCISDYCKRKYNRRCSREEIKQIYEGLKSRYLSKDSKYNLSATEICDELDKRLAFVDMSQMPTALQDFLWFDMLDRLLGNDGLFFKPTDTLLFDFRPMNNLDSDLDLDLMQTPYSYLEEFYQDEVYPSVRDAFQSLQKDKILSAPPPLVFDEQRSNYEKRVFVWVIDVDDYDKSVNLLESRDDGFDLTKDDLKEAKDDFDFQKEEEKESKKDIEKEIQLKKQEEKTYSKKLELLAYYEKLYKDEIISKAEYQKAVKKLI